MMEEAWQMELQEWLQKYRKFPDGLIFSATRFFEKVFAEVQYPKQFWFGIHSTRASLVVGGLYVAAIHRSADEDEGLWILVDQDAPRIKGLAYRPIKATEKAKYPLLWGHSASYEMIPRILSNEKLWNSFAMATRKVLYAPLAQSRDSVQQRRGKVCLADFWNFYADPRAVAEEKFFDDVQASLDDDHEHRLKRLALAPKEPVSVKVETRTFIRNPDVVGEVLFRAQGKCESCLKPAPFLRRKDDTPYLEVHHRIPLSEGGHDTVENALALCPNCHRKAHYG